MCLWVPPLIAEFALVGRVRGPPLSPFVQAFRSPMEEHHLISDLLQRFAVFKTGVGFTLKRQVRALWRTRTCCLA